MEQSTETSKASAPSNRTVIIAIAIAAAVIVAAIAVVAVVILRNNHSDNQQVIGYAAEAKVMLDKNELQAAMDEAVKNATEGRVGLNYKNDAYSDDGINFECHIVKMDSRICLYVNPPDKLRCYLSPTHSPEWTRALSYAAQISTLSNIATK